MARRISRIFIGAFVALSLAGATAGRADPMAPPSMDESKWRIDLTPYVFLPTSVEGDSTVAGQTASLDLDLSDRLDILDFAFATRAEAWKGDFGLIFDLSYVKLGADGAVNSTGPLTVGADVDVDIRQLYIDGMASWRVLKKPLDDAGRAWTLEAMAGGRYNYLKQEIDLKVKTGLGPGAVTDLGGSKTWVDPMLATRVAASLSER